MKKEYILQVLIATIMVLSTFAFIPASPSVAPQAHPALIEMVAEQPAQLVRVIVQKMAESQAVEELVAALDGQVATDLSMINAFAAERTADAALELAKDDSVRWVSLDAPVEQAGKPGPTILNRLQLIRLTPTLTPWGYATCGPWV